MYARYKPFRCQHRSTGADAAADSCEYHVTRGYPDQFLRTTPPVGTRRQQQQEIVSRAELVAALQQARQSKVVLDYQRATNAERICIDFTLSVSV